MAFKRINDIVKGGPSIILLNHITKISNIYIYIYNLGWPFPLNAKECFKIIPLTLLYINCGFV